MKIIGVSNFDNDTVNDIVIAENIRDKHYAEILLGAMRDSANPDDTYHPVLVEDDYELHVWEP